MILSLFNFLKGKKTYFVAAIGLIYGIVHHDSDIVMVSLIGITGRGAIADLKSSL